MAQLSASQLAALKAIMGKKQVVALSAAYAFVTKLAVFQIQKIKTISQAVKCFSVAGIASLLSIKN